MKSSSNLFFPKREPNDKHEVPLYSKFLLKKITFLRNLLFPVSLLFQYLNLNFISMPKTNYFSKFTIKSVIVSNEALHVIMGQDQLHIYVITRFFYEMNDNPCQAYRFLF